MRTIQIYRYLRQASGKHTYLPKITGIFPENIVRNQAGFVLQK